MSKLLPSPEVNKAGSNGETLEKSCLDDPENDPKNENIPAPAPKVKFGALFHQPRRWTISSAIGRVQSSPSSVTPLWNRSKSWLATICASRLSGRMFRSAQRASIARVNFSISPESRKSNMSSLPSETTSSEEYWKAFSTAQDAKNKEIASSSLGSSAAGVIVLTGETT